MQTICNWRKVVLLLFIVSLNARAEGPPKPATRALNPDIGANFLGLFRRNSRGTNDRTSLSRNGFVFQESEIGMTADVDPYSRASLLFSVKQEGGKTEYKLDPEEVYFESTSLPVVTLKAGKFKTAMGRHNQLHTHGYPFIDAPMTNTDLFGDEGLNEVGGSASALIPFGHFSEFTLQGVTNGNETFYKSGNSGHLAGVAQWRNLFDLSESLTLEIALYGTAGKNQNFNTSYAYGTDLILKWRPEEGGKYRALIWQLQSLGGKIRGNSSGERVEGVASWIQYQFAQRWWAQARTEYEGVPKEVVRETKMKHSALLGFFPSEFSGYRLQYDLLNVGGQRSGHSVALQWNISIGAHPAHAY